MNKNKLVIFRVNGKAVEEIEGTDIDLNGVENMKTNIAIMHGVRYDDVEVDTKDIYTPELSDCFVRDNGALMYQSKGKSNPVFVSGLRPSHDINHEELFHEWLGLIVDGKICEAIIFN